MRSLVIFCLLMIVYNADAQRQALVYQGLFPLKDSVSLSLELEAVVKNVSSGEILSKEAFAVKTDKAGHYLLEIGNGKRLAGNYDSIIWSEGTIALQITAIDTKTKESLFHETIIRTPSDLNRDFIQGTFTADEHPEWGVFSIVNSRGIRPRLVTVDLTTSYANLAYPKDTYPVYRHFEWLDEDRNGTGNAFMVSYSAHTNNAFEENTNLLGEVKLYPQPFQKVEIESGVQQILFRITKPESVKNLSETYGIKGPMKFIYYIEW